VVIDLNKKDFKMNIETDDAMKMQQLIDVLINRRTSRAFHRKLSIHQKKAFKVARLEKEVEVRNGLKQEDAKKIVKQIKDAASRCRHRYG
jgi:uncharacterized protein YajQ (UPF0234 family)